LIGGVAAAGAGTEALAHDRAQYPARDATMLSGVFTTKLRLKTFAAFKASERIDCSRC